MDPTKQLQTWLDRDAPEQQLIPLIEKRPPPTPTPSLLSSINSFHSGQQPGILHIPRPSYLKFISNNCSIKGNVCNIHTVVIKGLRAGLRIMLIMDIELKLSLNGRCFYAFELFETHLMKYHSYRDLASVKWSCGITLIFEDYFKGVCKNKICCFEDEKKSTHHTSQWQLCPSVPVEAHSLPACPWEALTVIGCDHGQIPGQGTLGWHVWRSWGGLQLAAWAERPVTDAVLGSQPVYNVPARLLEPV